MSVPKGESPECTGVVTRSKASGKVANREVRTEVSRTAVSVLTNRNYIQRLLGRMRYHMLPNSKTSKEDSAEIVDAAGIGTRILTLPREISNCTGYRLRSQQRP